MPAVGCSYIILLYYLSPHIKKKEILRRPYINERLHIFHICHKNIFIFICMSSKSVFFNRCATFTQALILHEATRRHVKSVPAQSVPLHSSAPGEK